jgi:aspartate kinase
MLVLKFGGTSVGSGERIVRVAEIALELHEREPVIVTSAMSGITDALLALAEAAAQGDRDDCDARLAAIEQRHWDATKSIDPEGDWSHLRDRFVALRDTIDAACAERVDSPMLRDSVICWGELLAVILVERAVDRVGGSGWAWDEPLIATDDHYGEATPDPEKTRELAAAAWSAFQSWRAAQPHPAVFVAPGFVGQALGYPLAVTSQPDFLEHRINYTTLGRGGSDYSATLIAAALGADACWIYTDVDGIFTADPRLVPEKAQSLPIISFAAAGRLALCGAKVLHPRSVAPAAQMGFELRVKNTFQPERAGTLLVASSEATQGLPLAVAGRRKLAMIVVEGPGLSTIRNLFGRLCAAIDAAGAEIVLAAPPVPGHDPRIIIDAVGSDAVCQQIQRDFAKELAQGRIAGVRANSGIALCTVVGDTLAPLWSTLAQRALASEKIVPIQHSAAPEALTYIINEADLDKAIKRLHREVIEPALRELTQQRPRPYADGQWAAGGRPQQRRRTILPQH